MNVKVKNPSTYVVLPVIQFLNAKNVLSVKIHRYIVEVYNEGATNERNLKNGVGCSKKGRPNKHETRSEHLPLVTDDLKEK